MSTRFPARPMTAGASRSHPVRSIAALSSSASSVMAPSPAVQGGAAATSAGGDAASHVASVVAQSSNGSTAGVTSVAGGAGTRILVGVRIRPSNRGDLNDDRRVVEKDPVDPQSVIVDDGRRGRSFAFDAVFSSSMVLSSAGGGAGAKVTTLDDDQVAVFEAFGRPMVTEAFLGFNVCLFAYGQTGSGKTHSILGPPGILSTVLASSAMTSSNGVTSPSQNTPQQPAVGTPDEASAAAPPLASPTMPTSDPSAAAPFSEPSGSAANAAATAGSSSSEEQLDPNAGILPRIAHAIFAEAQRRVEADKELTIKITMSYLEIYLERIRDLLSRGAAGPKAPINDNLEIHETATRRVYVKGLSIHPVLSPGRVMELLALGNSHRQTAETRMNEVSSRSHCIVQFTVSQIYDSSDRKDLVSTISIVDLAGSERQGKTEATGQHLEESKNINKSLFMLGRALNSFSSGGTSGGQEGIEGKGGGEFLSLRESKLTRLLSECFGGNAKTWMLATVSPAAVHLSETLSTLEYANNAKRITNRATINNIARQLEFAELQKAVELLEVKLDLLKKDSSAKRARWEAAVQEGERLRKGLMVTREVELSERLADLIAENDVLRGHIATLMEANSKPLGDDASLGASGSSSIVPRYVGRGTFSLHRALTDGFDSATLFLTPLTSASAVPDAPDGLPPTPVVQVSAVVSKKPRSAVAPSDSSGAATPAADNAQDHDDGSSLPLIVEIASIGGLPLLCTHATVSIWFDALPATRASSSLLPVASGGEGATPTRGGFVDVSWKKPFHLRPWTPQLKEFLMSSRGTVSIEVKGLC